MQARGNRSDSDALDCDRSPRIVHIHLPRSVRIGSGQTMTSFQNNLEEMGRLVELVNNNDLWMVCGFYISVPIAIRR